MKDCKVCGSIRPVYCQDCHDDATRNVADLERALAEARAENMNWADAFRDAMQERDAALALLREARDDVAEIASKQSKRHRIAQYQDLLAQIDRRLAGKDGD